MLCLIFALFRNFCHFLWVETYQLHSAGQLGDLSHLLPTWTGPIGLGNARNHHGITAEIIAFVRNILNQTIYLN